MEEIPLLALILATTFLSPLCAQDASGQSGIYPALAVAADPQDGNVTG